MSLESKEVPFLTDHVYKRSIGSRDGVNTYTDKGSTSSVRKNGEHP